MGQSRPIYKANGRTGRIIKTFMCKWVLKKLEWNWN